MRGKYLLSSLSLGIILLFSSTVSAQINIRKSIQGGYTLSHFSDDYNYNQQSLKAWTGGLGLQVKLLGTLAVEGDVLYSTKGTVATIPQNPVNPVNVRLDYVVFPVVVKYNLFPILLHPYILGGMEFCTLLSAKQGNENIKNEVYAHDKNWVIGCGAELSLLGIGLFAEGKMNLGGQEAVFKDARFKSVRNRNSQISIGILF